ncbi:hypothetical protein EVAR_38223_1 [Eumeta japonica]|uniref:DUF5641 domain-containing protein n=1 Tax=Eumeta variegata TaxID=151549 RepID=A0A4C1XE75_EUMVA|nr:hypothetical protein EVAR_38223_1 [Eumeta japonica]
MNLMYFNVIRAGRSPFSAAAQTRINHHATILVRQRRIWPEISPRVLEFAALFVSSPFDLAPRHPYSFNVDYDSPPAIDSNPALNSDFGTTPHFDSRHALDSNFSLILDFDLTPLIDFDPSLSQLSSPFRLRFRFRYRILLAVPSLPVTSATTTRYELIVKIGQVFWERWRREFFAELQRRTKRRTQEREISIGDVLVLKEDDIPPSQWRVRRVGGLYPHPDNISRVVDVKTCKGIVRRAINKLCPLFSSDW